MRKADKSAFDLIEEATHLLRVAPAATLATYYIAAIPFIIAFLYFCADMSRSPFAGQYLAEASLGMAAAFIWMKGWQALFALRIRAQLAEERVPRWSFRQILRVFFSQTVIQSSGLFVIPLALVFMLPFGWVYAFYQNITALADPDSSDTSRLVRRAVKQAALWPLQNHIGIGVMIAVGTCVFLNWGLLALWMPSLIKTLSGIETAFSKSALAMLNSTFFAGMCGLTYLCVDPLLKTIYLLRCFYGESLQSGEDLKADLKRFATSSRHVAALLVAQISPADLDRRIDQVIHERKYVWRTPRTDLVDNSGKGIITRFLQSVARMVRDWLRAVLDWLQDWIRGVLEPDRLGSGGAGSGSIAFPLLLYILLAAALSVLAIFLLRRWQARRHVATIEAEAIRPVPDVADESVGPDQLPEDGWTRLARELLDRGEFRLAMRALYLASLAHLADRNLIGIARFKSNRDYENELRRRGHAIPALLPIFGENVSTFERIWYGMYEADRDLVMHFAANVEKIRASA